MENNKLLLNKFKEFELLLENNKDEDEDIHLDIELAKNGKENIVYIDGEGNKKYFYSKYDPIRETDIFTNELDIKKEEIIVFYGTGIGYHMESILTKYPDNEYFIYESVPKVFDLFLQYGNIKNINKLVGIKLGNYYIGESLFDIIRNKKFQIVELKGHTKIFKEKNDEFKDTVIEYYENKIDSLKADYTFQSRWTINSINNFKYVLNTPNFLIGSKDFFKGKTAILVAAGPSLDYEIENLRYIKENKLAYIFAVGSAVNTLVDHGIFPDFLTSYDPKEGNKIVVEKIKEKSIGEIPIVFGSSIGYETIEDYPGEKYNFITSQDSVSNYFLGEDLKSQQGLIEDTITIAVITIQILSKLEFGKVILVGQNLGYLKEKRYSDGVDYFAKPTEDDLAKAIVVKDVYGQDIKTEDVYISMKNQIEHHITINPKMEFLNTTKGGAAIEGAEFKDLEVIIKEDLEGICRDFSLENTKYDLESLRDKNKRMDRDYKKIAEIIKDYKDIVFKIQKRLDNHNFKKIEGLYAKLEGQLSKLEKNKFFNVFILPMNRVEYEFLIDKIDVLNNEKNQREKAKQTIRAFLMFILACINSISEIEDGYNDMKNEIDKYIESRLEDE